MSRWNLNLLDYILKPTAEIDADLDSALEIKKDLETIDARFNAENAELMTSEFFDSVLSLEQENLNNEYDNGLFSNLDSDIGFTSENSSHGDELQSPNSSSSSESGQWSSYKEIDFSNVPDDTISSNELQNVIYEPMNIEEIQDATPVFQQEIPSKIIVQNPNTKKVIITKPYISSSRKMGPKTKQVFRVQSISGNGRSLLLPFNVTNIRNVKLVKANDLKSNNLKITGVTNIKPIKKENDTDSMDGNTEKDNQYPPLTLTDEEKRVLNKEGIQLPTHYPLTKKEERELKRIRRKIRNKISAQDSRKRKKEYVDGLEERVKRGCEENKFLLKRVKQLQKQNSRLMVQMSKLQALIFNTSSSKATPTTCLMIVLFSALLVSLPNLRLSQDTKLAEQQQVAARRALLFSQQATNEEDTLNMEEFLFFNKDDESELENMMFTEDENATEKDYGITKFIDELGKKYEIIEKNCSEKENGKTGFVETCKKFEDDIKNTLNNIKTALKIELKDFDENDSKLVPDGLKNKNGYIEPDIDDATPDVVGQKRKYVLSSDEEELILQPNKKIRLAPTDEFYHHDGKPQLVPVGDLHLAEMKQNIVSATVGANTYGINTSKKE